MDWLNISLILVTIWFYLSYFGQLMLELIFSLFLKFLEYMDRKRIIKDRVDNEDYLERYYLFLKDRQTFPFNIFLHKFLKSDTEDLHDHPWNFTTIILSGGYWEYTPLGKTWYGPGSVIVKKATDFHRIELDPSMCSPNYANTWTLFIPGKKQRQWGFKTNKGSWIHHEEYLEQKKNKTI